MTRSRVLFPLPPHALTTVESVIGIYYKLISYFMSGFVSAAVKLWKSFFTATYAFYDDDDEQKKKKQKKQRQQGPSLYLVSLDWPVSCHVPLSQKWHIKFNGNWWALIMIWDSLASYALSLLPHDIPGVEGGWFFQPGSVTLLVFLFLSYCCSLCACVSSTFLS